MVETRIVIQSTQIVGQACVGEIGSGNGEMCNARELMVAIDDDDLILQVMADYLSHHRYRHKTVPLFRVRLFGFDESIRKYG